MTLAPYIRLARIDNWPKNLVILIGVMAAYALSAVTPAFWPLLEIICAACLASSANYVLNESLDASSDAYHPLKKERMSVRKMVNIRFVQCEYTLLAALALTLAIASSQMAGAIIAVYLACAWLYNIPPLRWKDRPYWDIILESINYPLRIWLGWCSIMNETWPPSSLLITSWALGAFMMSLKRLVELQLFTDHETAIKYRRSYRAYSANNLAVIAFVCALCAIFGSTILLLKYKISLLLMLPSCIALLAWYFAMALQQRLFILYPEQLVHNKTFLMLCSITLFTAVVALKLEIPSLGLLTAPLQFHE